MVGRTNRETVLECIRSHPEGLDDDQVSEFTRVKPRQQVYQIATRLEAEGLIDRRSVIRDGRRRKICSFPRAERAIETEGASAQGLGASPAWKRRLAALVAATGAPEGEILERALSDYARRVLEEGISR